MGSSCRPGLASDLEEEAEWVMATRQQYAETTEMWLEKLINWEILCYRFSFWKMP